ncbi:hypothetical protein EBZ37_00775 [bacterium]|nr:hypothetical protein [bacterium]
MTKKQEFVLALQQFRILEARIRNRDLGPAEKLAQENSRLLNRIAEVESQLFSVLAKEGLALPEDLERARLDKVRNHALDFLKTLKVDPKLWQDLASL